MCNVPLGRDLAAVIPILARVSDVVATPLAKTSVGGGRLAS
jgi:hypothetical protein